MIQSRQRRDWIINSLPSGIESQTPYGALTQDRISVLKRQKTFYLAVPPRQIKIISLCPL